MRSLIAICGATLLFAVASALPLRLVSYNIQSGSGMDYVYNLKRTADAIVALNPDIIGLQEVDNRTARHPGDDQTALLSEMTKLPFHRFQHNRDYQGGGYGVAILSRYPFEAVKEYRYHKPGQPVGDCKVPADADFCQGALAVLIRPPGQKGPFWFVTTHLGIGLNNTQQTIESQQLVDFAKTELLPTAPVFLTGDFNTEPGSPCMRNLEDAGFVDSWPACGTPKGGNGYTFSSAKPHNRIDYVWASNTVAPTGAKCVETHVPETQASDHFPLVSNWQFP